jgi:methylated-DNA-[protein]-cysteine S-methyltransferase
MMALSPSPGSFAFDTALGFFAIAWSKHGLTRLILPEPDAEAARARLAAQPAGLAPALAENALPVEIAGLVAAIRRYAEGETVDFAFAPVDLTQVDDFRRDIYAAARRLTHGEAVTYGELAALAGHPGAARETGVALARNPVPLVVPCHRIVAAGGRLGGFSAPGGATTKMRLLAHERAKMPERDAAQGSFAF